MSNVFENTTQSTIYRDKTPLDPEITPTREELVCREQQINELVNHFQDLIRYGVANNLMLTGDTGVGKTATVRAILTDLRDYMNGDRGFKAVYTTDLTNERDALRTISKRLNLDFYGASELSEYYDRLEQKLTEEDIAAVIVFDEVDKLFEDGRAEDHGNPLFKRLLEARNRVNSADTGSLVLVGITNNTKTPDYFDPRVESRFGNETIHFPTYDMFQLKKILQTRGEKSFRPKALEDGVISKCAALVASTDGDARKAIELLRKAGELAEDSESGTVRKQHVDDAKQALEEERIVQAVRSCSKQSKLVLHAAFETQEQAEVTTGDLYEEYELLTTKYDVKELTKRRVRDLIEKLDNMQLLDTVVTNPSSGRGRTQRISVPLADDLVERVGTEIEAAFIDE